MLISAKPDLVVAFPGRRGAADMVRRAEATGIKVFRQDLARHCHAAALSDVTVLDFSRLLQGPFATQLLGDMGANVIKIERPGAGDLFRSMTFNNQWLGERESPNFLAWDRNKRSLALDLKPGRDEKARLRLRGVPGREPAHRLLLGVRLRRGRALRHPPWPGRANPRPHRAAAATGRADGPPVPVGAGFADQVGAMNMVYGILTALYWRERSGVGQEVKVDLLGGLLAHQGQEMLTALNFGRDFERPRSGIGHPGMDAPFGVYPTQDGWITIAMSPFRTLVGILGDETMLAYDDPKRLFEERDEIWERIAALTGTGRRASLLDALLAADIWCGEVKTHLQAGADPQVRHNGLIRTVEHPTAGAVQVVGPAVRLGETPAEIERAPPLVGQHSHEILSEFGFSAKEIDKLFEARAVVQLEPG